MVNTLQIISISFAALFVLGASIAFLRFNLYGRKNMHGVSGSHIRVINPSMSLDHQLASNEGKTTWIDPGSELIIRDLTRQRKLKTKEKLATESRTGRLFQTF